METSYVEIVKVLQNYFDDFYSSDIRAPKSAFALISSALLPGTDLQGGAAEGPNLTQPGYRHFNALPA